MATVVAAVAAHRPGRPVPAAVVDPADAPSSSARTRLALQSTIAVMLGFIAGQLLFPTHWPWTVITVMTVSLVARSRGEVLVRSGQRLAGAALATAVATPLAAAVAPHRPLAVAVILGILGLGTYLRERSYVWWVMAVTASLALLYGLLGQTGGAGLLAQRLLAIGVGAACAIGPALVLAPRTRSLVRKRTGTCIRRLRDLLGEPGVATLRRLETAVVELERAAVPLRLTRGRTARVEREWVRRFAGTGPDARSLVVSPEPEALDRLQDTLRTVGAEVRSQRRPDVSTVEAESARSGL
jgi:uncharacterized membrane protein YccC